MDECESFGHADEEVGISGMLFVSSKFSGHECYVGIDEWDNKSNNQWQDSSLTAITRPWIDSLFTQRDKDNTQQTKRKQNDWNTGGY